MTDASIEHVKKFVFTSKYNIRGESKEEKLEILIPERLQATYSLYTWPCASVLAWFIWENRIDIKDKRVLEIGSGTALPGIVAAKCGAKVTLSESALLPKSLAHTQRSCQFNNLLNEVKIVGLTWGLLLNNLEQIQPVDIILGSDCFYDPTVFEDILVTISFLLDRYPLAKFLCAYQERSSDWSIEHLLQKWDLNCYVHNTSEVGKSAGINVLDLIGGHTIHLLEISRN